MSEFKPGMRRWAKNLTNLIHILFALTINQCLLVNSSTIQQVIIYDDYHNLYSLKLVTIVLIFCVIILSWVGYHQSISGYRYRDSKFGYSRAFIDILILVLYTAMVFQTGYPTRILWGVFLVHFLYFIGGLTRIMEWKDSRVSKWPLAILACVVFLIIALLSQFFMNSEDIPQDIFIWGALIAVFLYRLVRQKIGYPAHNIIAVDIDGVLADQVTGAIDYLRKKKKMALTTNPEDVNDWHYMIDGKLDIATFFEETFKLDPDFALQIPPIEGAIQGMKRLAGKFHIIIITSRPFEAFKNTTEWLKTHRIKYHEIFYSKAGRKTDIGFTILVDDYPFEAKKAANSGIPTMLLSHPYNLGIENDPDYRPIFADKMIIRNENWDEIVRNIEDILYE